ncbi:hypothetical protein L1887_59071 [Cichorium endivia]|nr:hypothetical protein L1887_59071 [Cichorium endivia]
MRDRWWAGGLPRVSLAPMLCWAESRVRCLIAGPRVPACRCRAALQHTRTHASMQNSISPSQLEKKNGLHPPASGLKRSHPLRCPLSSPTPAISFHPRLHLASFLRMDENRGRKRERTFWGTETVSRAWHCLPVGAGATCAGTIGQRQELESRPRIVCTSDTLHRRLVRTSAEARAVRHRCLAGDPKPSMLVPTRSAVQSAI